MEDKAITVAESKVLSKEDLKTKQELATGHVTQLKNLIYEQGILFVEIGRLLKIIRDEELYKYMGDGGYDSFTMFVNNSDIGLKQATAYAYIRIYEVYVMKMGYKPEQIADVPWYKLHLLAARVHPKDKEEAKEWLEKARTLGNGDFIEEMKGHTANEGKSDNLPYPHMYRCKTCGKYRTDEIEKMCTC